MHSGDRFGLSEDIFGMRVTHAMRSAPLVGPPSCRVVFLSTKFCKLVMSDGNECSIPMLGDETEGCFSQPFQLVFGHHEFVFDFGNSNKMVTEFTTTASGDYLVAIDFDISKINDIPKGVEGLHLTNPLPLNSTTVAFTDAYTYVAPVVTPAVVTPKTTTTNNSKAAPAAILAAVAAYFAFKN